MSEQPTCERCRDTGTTELCETRTSADGEVVSRSYSTLLCECRRALPPRDGKARWWALENILSIDVTVPIFGEAVHVRVDAELPISDENFRVYRHGNRYYPTLIEIETPNSLSLHACTARDLARALLQAAEAAEKIDDADTDTCGHWFHCGCQAEAR